MIKNSKKSNYYSNGGTTYRKDIALIFLSAFLLVISFPKFDLSIVSWIALIPLLYVIQGKSVYRTFLIGWLCGVIFYTGLIYWIVVVTTTYGKLSYPLGILVMLLLVSYLSLYFGCALAGAQFIEKKTSLKVSMCLPFIWVTMEYLRSFLFTGFPWENLGYSQYRSLLLIQCADITGVYGITFLIVYINTTLYLLLRGITTKIIPYKEITFAILLLIATTLYGKVRLTEMKKLTDSSTAIKVGLVQANIDQNIKWNLAFRKYAMEVHQALTLKAREENARLVIWSEASTPFYLQSEPDYQHLIFSIIGETSTYLLLGSPVYDQRDGRWHNFNSAFLLSPHSKIVGRYDKIHLVPYGEYVPLKRFFPFIDKMVEGIGDFHSGETITLLNLPEASCGVLICYEIIFPDLTRRFVKQGAHFLTNITNDAWFGNTSAPYQHLSMVVFRAIENRRSIARAANTGISALIDATGEIKTSSTLFTETLITGTITILHLSTFYTTYGDVFAYFSTLFSAIVFLSALIRKSNHEQGRNL